MKKTLKALEVTVGDLIFSGILIGCTLYASPIVESSLKSNLYKPKIEISKIESEKKDLEIKIKESSVDSIKSFTQEEINKYIDSTYNKINLPNYITKDYIRVLIEVESNNNPYAVSDWGAKGLGQLMKNTWNDYEKNISYEDGVFNPKKNLEVTLKHLRWQDTHLKNNYPNWFQLNDNKKLKIHSIAYNWGMGKLMENNWNIDEGLPSETKNHFMKISEKYDDLIFN